MVQENKLKLNPTKCQAIRVYFGNKEIPDDDLFIANQQLAVVDKVKLLGIIIRDDLEMGWSSWKRVPKPSRILYAAQFERGWL